MKKNKISNISAILRKMAFAIAFRPFLAFFSGFFAVMVITAVIFVVFFGLYFNPAQTGASGSKEKNFYSTCNEVFLQWDQRKQALDNFSKAALNDPFANAAVLPVDQPAK